MSNSSDYCITSNPDISGIGVRSAIYAQNFITFIPAVYALWDKRVSLLELESLETESTTVLITAFAILLSTVIQALASAHSVSSFHAAVVLNLSWMNNTNTFIYFLLRLYHEAEDSDNPGVQSRKSIRTWLKLTRKALPNFTMIIGSLHLTLMSAVGIWLWSDPAGFGGGISSSSCVEEGFVFVVGRRVSFASEGLRIWSLLIYGLLLVPGLNLVLPIAFFLSVYIAFDRTSAPKLRENKLLSVVVGLTVLAMVDILLVADIEAALALAKKIPLYLEPGDGSWTFGQTLALLLLLVACRDIIETFLERRAKRLGKDVLDALEKGETSAVLHALKTGANPSPDALEIAIRENYLSVVKYLIEKSPVSDSNKALHSAAERGHLDIVRYLILRGFSVDAQDSSGQTPLLLAARNGHLEVVRCFLDEEQASIDAKDHWGRTALLAAARNGHLEVVRYFVDERQASINDKDSMGQTPLFLALGHGHLEVAHYLVDKRQASINTKDSRGRTVLLLAAEKGHLEVVHRLVDEKQASIDTRDYLGRTALFLAAQNGHLRVLEEYLDNDWTALQHATMNGHPQTVQHLRRNQSDFLNATDRLGRTALDIAQFHGHVDVEDYLRERQ